MERIAVTGIGAVTPLGVGRQELWEGLLAGRCATGPVTSFDTSAYPVDRGGEIRSFDPARYLETLDPAELGRASQLAAAAARLALLDAGIDTDGADGTNGAYGLPGASTGVAMGTTSGEPLEVERYNERFVAGDLHAVGGELAVRYPNHNIARAVAAEVGAEAGVTMIPTACAAGSYAIAHAFDELRRGRAEVMLAGGADAFSRITYTGFSRLGAISPDVCRPFDRERQGMIPAEGAAVLVLEPLSRARRRGARVYALIAGYGLSCDAHHMTGAHPEGDGAARAMLAALADSRLDAADVSYVSAHGTGTPSNDRLESAAVQRVFTRRRIPISSVKSMLGHTMGAASAIEAAVCALAVAEDRVPPTANFLHPDPECPLDCVPNEAREMTVTVAMNNAYAFGGNNASMIFEKVRAA